MHHNSEISRYIREMAASLGFCACGFTHARAFEIERPLFLAHLQQRHHAGMNYLENNLEKRLNPELLQAGTKSIIVLSAGYYHENEPRIGPFRVSRYAAGKDYHKVLKKRAKPLLNYLIQEAGAGFARVLVDSAPVLEKALAVRAGLGFIGKNNLLIIPGKGSFHFLAVIYTDLELPVDKPYTDSLCGLCKLCLDACPGGALLKEGGIDARKCISYLTIENKDEVLTYDFNPDGWVFGCDICQDVCPFNKNPIPGLPEFVPSKDFLNVLSDDPDLVNEVSFSAINKGVIRRAGIRALVRNMKAAAFQ